MSRDNFLRKIATTLRSQRKLLGLSQIELSNKVNVNYRHLQKIESGKVDLKASTLNNLGHALDIPTCFLVENANQHSLNSMHIACPTLILDMLKIGIQVNDPSGLIRYVNKTHAQMLGYSVGEIINKKYIWDFLDSEAEKENLKSYLGELIAEKPTPKVLYKRNLSASGEVIPIKIDWEYIFNRDREVIGFLSILTFHPSW